MRLVQAETNWRTSAEELAALKKLHDGVHGQLREALDRNSLQEQETIEVVVNALLFILANWAASNHSSMHLMWLTALRHHCFA